MFKGFQDTSRSQLFKGFPNLNFQMNNEAYGFSGCTFWLHAAYGLKTQTDLAAVSSWQDRKRSIDFLQATAGNQPRLVVADAAFGNKPVIEFQAQQRYLQTVTGGANINFNGTTVFVFQRLTSSSGANPKRTQLIGTEIAANAGTSFSMESNDVANAVGMMGPSTFSFYDTTFFDTNPHIVVISGLNFIENGAAMTPTGTSWISFVGSVLSGSVTRSSGTFKLAELLTYEDLSLSSTDCIRLSDNVNNSNSYAIY